MTIGCSNCEHRFFWIFHTSAILTDIFFGWQIDKIIDCTSDAQLYKQAGNGVTVNVIEAIGRLLQKADSELNALEVSEKGTHQA